MTEHWLPSRQGQSHADGADPCGRTGCDRPLREHVLRHGGAPLCLKFMTLLQRMDIEVIRRNAP